MDNYKTITFGGGCFWCIESCFNRLKGVESAISGYADGHTKNPNYKEVCTGDTGHAEVVQLTYNPSVISFDQLLDVFFFLHDPTQLDRQGNDIGTQYRSIVFYNDEMEKELIKKKISIINASKTYEKTIVTQVVPKAHFWPAETYHQGYYLDNPNQPYCSAVVGPKIKKFLAHFQPLGLVKE
jgi:peptide-methionine (S)-S-oxide reductase